MLLFFKLQYYNGGIKQRRIRKYSIMDEMTATIECILWHQAIDFTDVPETLKASQIFLTYIVCFSFTDLPYINFD